MKNYCKVESVWERQASIFKLMNIENRWTSVAREEDLMSPEELESWIKHYSNMNRGDDPLELLGRNKGRDKKMIELKGGGPDDGDSL